MLKRTILTLVAFAATLLANAQGIGSWQVYPSYWIASQNLAVGTKVYCLTISQETEIVVDKQLQKIYSYNLLCYDTEDSSVKTYDCLNDLNDLKIEHMAYSQQARRLILVYENGNIDLLDLDDNVQNIASLKESTLTNRTVSDVFVDGSTAYLATGFGYITVDMAEGVIRETYQLGLDVQQIGVKDEVIYLGTSSGLYCSTDENLHLASNWKKVNATVGYNAMEVFDGELLILHTSSKKVYKLDENGNFAPFLANGNLQYLTQSNGKLLIGNPSVLHVYASKSNFRTVETSGDWKWVACTSTTYWACQGHNGMHGYKLSEGQFTETVGTIQPNSPVRDFSYRMHYVGDRLLVAGGINTPYAIYNATTAMYYEDGQWTNFDEATPVEQYPSLRHWNTTNLVQDPNDPSHHFASPYRTGLYEYRDGKLAKLYNSENSPIQQIGNHGLNYNSAVGLQYDADGNLWMCNQETDTIIRVLTASGQWRALYYAELAGIPTCDDYLFSTSGINFLVCRRKTSASDPGFFGFKTNGTLNSTRDDKHILRSRFENEDGTSYSPNQFYCMAEDLNGQIWCGTDDGLFVIEDPETYFDEDFTFLQIKIARDDGSGLADYLLSGVAVTCIAVDGANRKWIGTNNNGLYLISADGQEMVHHFQTSDSPLLSDNIQCIAIHPTSGLVMIGTDAGLCSYMADATEAEEELNYDNVKSYPNPVGPDYTGPITVDGLSMDSEVKICTTTGQLVWSGTSNGGRFTWNGCNKQGKRVASGVYNVVANNAAGKKAIVTRIVVIR